MPGMTYDAVDLEQDGQFNRPGGSYEIESPERIPIGRFDRSLLRNVDSAVVRSGGRPPLRPGGGNGNIQAREMWGERDFRSCFRYLRQYALPPQSTMGPYVRQLIEEVFFVLSGEGVITIAGEPLPVKAGDIVFAGLGESRYLAGPTGAASAELVLWNVGVAKDQTVDETADCNGISA